MHPGGVPDQPRDAQERPQSAQDTPKRRPRGPKGGPFGGPKASKIDQKSKQNEHQKNDGFQVRFFIILRWFWSVFYEVSCEQKRAKLAKPGFLETLKNTAPVEAKSIF